VTRSLQHKIKTHVHPWLKHNNNKKVSSQAFTYHLEQNYNNKIILFKLIIV